jgi:hypothetical protein
LTGARADSAADTENKSRQKTGNLQTVMSKTSFFRAVNEQKRRQQFGSPVQGLINGDGV